jgi:hypothetical protein
MAIMIFSAIGFSFDWVVVAAGSPCVSTAWLNNGRYKRLWQVDGTIQRQPEPPQAADAAV